MNRNKINAALKKSPVRKLSQQRGNVQLYAVEPSQKKNYRKQTISDTAPIIDEKRSRLDIFCLQFGENLPRNKLLSKAGR